MCPSEWTGTGGALDRAIAILEAFTKDDAGLPVTELARRVGLARSTTHRLVDRLVEHELLKRDGSRVQLGMKVFEIGQRVPQQRNLRTFATPFLVDLREATRQTINLAVLDGTDIVYLERLLGPSSPPLPSSVGGRHPAHASALGKAILSASPKEAVETICSAGLRPVTPHTITDPEVFRAAVETASATGVAVDHEEAAVGIFCVASPVLGRYQRVLGAISVTGLTRRADIPHNKAAVQNAALNLSRMLGAGRTRAGL